MTDFGNAGIENITFGKKNQFKHRLQHPWGYEFCRDLDLIDLILKLNKDFSFIESFSSDGYHTAHMIYNKTGTKIDIEIYEKGELKVYPASNDHQAASEKIYDILTKNYSGKLLTWGKKHD